MSAVSCYYQFLEIHALAYEPTTEIFDMAAWIDASY